jgi:hypothetical protein
MYLRAYYINVMTWAIEQARTNARSHDSALLLFPPGSIAAASRRERWLALVCLHVAPLVGLFVSITKRQRRRKKDTLFRKQASFRMQRISSLNEGEAGRQASANLKKPFAAFRLSQCTGINRYLLSLVIYLHQGVQVSRRWCRFGFFSPILKLFWGTGHILSREKFTYSWSPICTLISLVAFFNWQAIISKRLFIWYVSLDSFITGTLWCTPQKTCI